jgi:hypothetical protein
MTTTIDRAAGRPCRGPVGLFAALLATLLAAPLACTATPRATDTAASPGPGPAPVDATAGIADDGGATPSTGCRTDADCGGNAVCEGEGCGDVLGTCAPADRMCTRDAQSYCDCAGVTFVASGSCPGRRFAHRGVCERAKPKPDGTPCDVGSECESGVCEGEGCDAPGVCKPAQRPCTKDLREYCGCDGKTFRGSGSCPGSRFSKRGAC